MAASPSGSDRSLVISYLTLRKAVGLLGMLLPLFLFAGSFFRGGCAFPPSISHFYYTPMGDVLVGVLCAISLFLFSYNGYDRRDKRAARLAALSAMLVALFPTDPGAGMANGCSRMLGDTDPLSNTLHYASATVLFCILAYFSLFLFTRTDRSGPVAGAKRIRNRIYRGCGRTILCCIMGIAIANLLPEAFYRYLRPLRPTFTLETLALLAFGFSWLIKGEAFYRDRPARSGIFTSRQ